MSNNKKIEAYEIKEGEYVEARIKGNFPYKRIIEILLSGNAVFLPINRKQAHYLRRSLEKKMNELVEAYPIFFKDMEGYEFHFSMAEKMAQKLFGEEKAK